VKDKTDEARIAKAKAKRAKEGEEIEREEERL